MNEPLNSRQVYKVYGLLAYLTRGVFHLVSTGRFLGYEHEAPRHKISVLMDACDKCKGGDFWVTLDELDAAEGVIACENCGELIKPVERVF